MRAGRIMDFSPFSDGGVYYIDITIETSHNKYEKIRITHENEADFELGVRYWGAIFMASETVHENGLFSPEELEAPAAGKMKNTDGQPSNPFFTFGVPGRK